LHCLFRNHSGQAWFDDVSVVETRAEGGAVLFQGVPVVPGHKQSSTAAAPTPPTAPLVTAEGLTLTMSGSTVASLKFAGKEMASDAPSGFLVRDVADNSDIYAFQHSECPELGLKIKTQFLAQSNHVAIEGRLSDLRGKDRAVTLVFALPIDALGWSWGDDIRHTRRIEGPLELSSPQALWLRR